VLNIGQTVITFDGSGSPTWGLITLEGKLTSSHTYGDGIITLSNGTSVNSTADIESLRSAIYNASTGTVNISGGILNPHISPITMELQMPIPSLAQAQCIYIRI